jgi:hypothetical protein
MTVLVELSFSTVEAGHRGMCIAGRLKATSTWIITLHEHFRCTALDFVVYVLDIVLAECASGRVRSCVAERCCIGC